MRARTNQETDQADQSMQLAGAGIGVPADEDLAVGQRKVGD